MQQPGPQRDLLWIGFGATSMALAVLWVVSGFASGVPFAPTALAGALVRETPGDVATFFIEALGHWALRLVTAGALATALVVGAVTLRMTARPRPRPVLAGAALLALAGAASVASPEDVAPIPTAAALLATFLTYVGCVALAIRPLKEPQPEEIDLGRRQALRFGTGTMIGVALGGGVIGWIARRLGGPDRNVQVASPVDLVPTPSEGSFKGLAGLPPEVTSADEHYVVDINLVRPTVEVAGWTLPVTGEVERPLELTFESMQNDFEVVEDYSVLTCISNEVGGPLVGHSAWRGVRLADVLEAAGVRTNAMDVVFRAADGYTDSIPLEVARDPAVLLAIAQNGEPLTQDHGFPCRVRIPAIYGMKNVKWLLGIEAVARDYKGYWMKRGWSDRAVVKTQSRIDVAGSGALRVGEATWIAGVAWAGDRGVRTVEVSTDGGETWEAAELKEALAEDSWRLWAYRWVPSRAGGTSLMCRATDGNGDVQQATRTPPHPNGAGGYHSVDVEVG
jgi:hypothetical protein